VRHLGRRAGLVPPPVRPARYLQRKQTEPLLRLPAMARRTKLMDLMVKETSGVDHPAHLHEGWLVIKAEELDATLSEVDQVNKETHVDLEVTENETVVDKAAEVEEDIRKELSDLRKQLEEARLETEAIRSQRDLEKAIATSHDWAILPELNPQEFAPVLCSLRAGLPEVAEVIEKVLDASARALKESGILKELGTDTPASEVDAYAKIEAMARQLVSEGRADSFAKAVSIVASQNKDLYTEYLNEKGL